MVRVTRSSILALSLTLTGCAAARPEPVYVRAEYVPPGIYSYPHITYEGEVAYLVDGRWYYRRGPSWVYYYREPAPLQRYRIEHYRARPAYTPHVRYVAPPAHPARRERYSAPPAHSPRTHYVAPPAQRERRDSRRAPPARRPDRDPPPQRR